jgi:hypothetical protein
LTIVKKRTSEHLSNTNLTSVVAHSLEGVDPQLVEIASGMAGDLAKRCGEHQIFVHIQSNIVVPVCLFVCLFFLLSQQKKTIISPLPGSFQIVHHDRLAIVGIDER